MDARIDARIEERTTPVRAYLREPIAMRAAQ